MCLCSHIDIPLLVSSCLLISSGTVRYVCVYISCREIISFVGIHLNLGVNYLTQYLFCSQIILEFWIWTISGGKQEDNVTNIKCCGSETVVLLQWEKERQKKFFTLEHIITHYNTWSNKRDTWHKVYCCKVLVCFKCCSIRDKGTLFSNSLRFCTPLSY